MPKLYSRWVRCDRGALLEVRGRRSVCVWVWSQHTQISLCHVPCIATVQSIAVHICAFIYRQFMMMMMMMMT